MERVSKEVKFRQRAKGRPKILLKDESKELLMSPVRQEVGVQKLLLKRAYREQPIGWKNNLRQ